MNQREYHIEIATVDSGGAHNATAEAICEIARRQERPWRITVKHMDDFVNQLDLLKKVFGFNGDELYNKILRSGQYWLHTIFLQHYWYAGMRALQTKGAKLLADYFRSRPVDLVLSVVPLYQFPLWSGIQQGGLDVPFITLMTELEEYRAHYWIDSRTGQYLICPEAKAEEQARARGLPAARIHRTSGMVVNPKFYDPFEGDRREERQRIGLDPDLPTALVLFGGEGSNVMLDIFERLDRSHLQLQLILICGKNKKVYEALRHVHGRLKHVVEGFTSEVPYFMRLSDFIIGKTGALQTQESLVMQLPLIVMKSWNTLPQEKHIAGWLERNDVAICIPSYKDVVGAVERMLDRDFFKRTKEKLESLSNRGVYEVADLLQSFLTEPRSSTKA